MRQPVLAAAALALLSPNVATALPEKQLVHARHTQTVDLAVDGMSPKPTAPPQLLGARDLGLLRRQDNLRGNENTDQTVLVAPDATCGYISSRSGAYYTCAGDFTCMFYTPEASSSGNVACCENFENCNMRSACVASKDFEDDCDDGCVIDIYTLKCTNSDSPYCNTVSFAGGIYDYWCNNVDIKGPQAAETTYSGQGQHDFEAVALTDVFTDSSTDTTSSVTSDATSNTSDDAGPSNTGDTSDPTDTSSSDDNGGGTPVGPIVGGVVGGVGALGIVGLAAWLLIRRRNAKSAGDSGTPPSQVTPQAYSALPMQHPTPPPHSGYYDQNAQYYNVQHHVPPPASSTPGTMHTNTASYASSSPAYGGYTQPPPPVIHEAPSRPSEMLRDERHELQ